MQLARQRGYGSYGQERAHLELAERIWPGLRAAMHAGDGSMNDVYSSDSVRAYRTYMQTARNPDVRHLYSQGFRYLLADTGKQDHSRAQRIARRLGWEGNPTPATRGVKFAPALFWYH
jgi:hypothetical protein